jgi:hypothetical protein
VCSFAAPALGADCQAAPSDLPDGIYRFRGTFFFADGKPMCLTIDGDGNYKENICNDLLPNQKFHLGERVGQCYKIRQIPTKWLALTDFHSDSDGIAQLFGWGDTQLIPGCVFDAARVQWQIRETSPGSQLYELRDRATGKCMQIDGSDLSDGGAVNAINCRGTHFETWALERYTANEYDFSLQPGATMTIHVTFNSTLENAVSLRNKLDPAGSPFFGPWPGCGNDDHTHPTSMTYTNTGTAPIPFAINAGYKYDEQRPGIDQLPWHFSNGIVKFYSAQKVVIGYPNDRQFGLVLITGDASNTEITITVSAGQLPDPPSP